MLTDILFIFLKLCGVVADCYWWDLFVLALWWAA